MAASRRPISVQFFWPAVVPASSPWSSSSWLWSSATKGLRRYLKYWARRSGVCLKDALLALLTPVIILGGIYSGTLPLPKRPSSPSSQCLCVSMFIYKEMSWKELAGVFL